MIMVLCAHAGFVLHNDGLGEPEVCGRADGLAGIIASVGDRWGREGPPEEAYGRVADSGRYRTLHAVGWELLDELERRYAVTRATSTEPDVHGSDPAPVVRLVPADPAAAALTMVFGAYPGLLIRMGCNSGGHLPVCGCDACDETVEQCTDQLRHLLAALTAGTFGERLVRDHGWWHERWYQTPSGRSSGRTRIDGQQRRALKGTLPRGELRWAPWPERAPR
jgi:hypothetical protein